MIVADDDDDDEAGDSDSDRRNANDGAASLDAERLRLHELLVEAQLRAGQTTVGVPLVSARRAAAVAWPR